MPQSTFAAEGTQFIDGIDPAYALAGIWNLDAIYLGGSKTAVRRSLGRFDVFGAAISGRALTATDALTAAELVLETTSVAGPSAWAARIERITRADWDYTTGNWTVAGGDVGTPPAAVAFTSPVAAGEFVVSSMLPFVTDAITNRSGLVLLRLKADDEQPAQSQWCAFDAFLPSTLRPRLRVTYTATEPSAIDHPHKTTIPIARAETPEQPSQPERAAPPSRGRAPSPVARRPNTVRLRQRTRPDRRRGLKSPRPVPSP